MSPNVERLALWADRLDNPASRQARFGLRDAHGAMCCLGHACEVFREQTGKGWWLDGGGFDTGSGRGFGYMPNEVAAWYGVASDPMLDGMLATSHNDVHHRTLSEIAALIRAEFGIDGGAS